MTPVRIYTSVPCGYCNAAKRFFDERTIAFEEIDLNDQQALSQTGLRFRRTVLALGGSLDPNQVFIQFRGRPPSVDALLRHNGLESAPN